ncbi:hypothetical protein QVD17_30813 [Tagetes erecta]|uniref:Uncharacterized protein n=1 Tax=Tagetes erecta TaxID=13708 RepID=A0AAD8K283_TARER|nr:hypothetical protein QVD17_30813 [Tagetes erecta]
MGHRIRHLLRLLSSLKTSFYLHSNRLRHHLRFAVAIPPPRKTNANDLYGKVNLQDLGGLLPVAPVAISRTNDGVMWRS